MSCGTCKFWKLESGDWEGAEDEDKLGSCHALETVPYAWKYATREVIWTIPTDGEGCTYWKR